MDIELELYRSPQEVIVKGIRDGVLVPYKKYNTFGVMCMYFSTPERPVYITEMLELWDELTVDEKLELTKMELF